MGVNIVVATKQEHICIYVYRYRYIYIYIYIYVYTMAHVSICRLHATASARVVLLGLHFLPDLTLL